MAAAAARKKRWLRVHVCVWLGFCGCDAFTSYPCEIVDWLVRSDTTCIAQCSGMLYSNIVNNVVIPISLLFNGSSSCSESKSTTVPGYLLVASNLK